MVPRELRPHRVGLVVFTELFEYMDVEVDDFFKSGLV
jgi:hypothetical protein